MHKNQAKSFVFNKNIPHYERASKQEHAQLRRGWVWDKEIKDTVLVTLGCDCRACKAHLDLIRSLNPKRWELLWNPDKPEDQFFRPKRVSPEQWFSRNRGKSLNRMSIL